ncbi:uncharacterized protein LOC6569399 isoform X2 [Drosophila grimshawi]|uniref:uncharacterized protein LOC6569399 isoform X2 n=1 Tax=Drosophila grimshawi TaxID=7222 RepID=UPI000C86F411|nr:uncharacterized protein LOC6569399 isoform X2 [Drosophila grimshawi]
MRAEETNENCLTSSTAVATIPRSTGSQLNYLNVGKQELVRRCQFRRELQQQKQVRQVRKQMSDQCYADWLHLKRRSRVKASTTTAEAAALVASTSEQRHRCLRQWEQRKQHESQQRREQQLRAKEQQHMDERVREQLSRLSWQRWLAQLAVKSLKPRFATGQPGKTRSSAGGAASPVLTQQQRRKLQQQLATISLRMPLSVAQRALCERDKASINRKASLLKSVSA